MILLSLSILNISLADEFQKNPFLYKKKNIDIERYDNGWAFSLENLEQLENSFKLASEISTLPSFVALSKTALGYSEVLKALKSNEPPSQIKKHILNLSNENFHSGKLEVAFWTACDLTLPTCYKDIMVFLPGLGEGLSGLTGNYVMESIKHRKKYHILTIPNPWSSDYLKFQPKATIADFESEAKAILEIVRAAKEQIFLKEGRIKDEIADLSVFQSRVHLLGISYGGFLSVVSAALDSGYSSLNSIHFDKNKKPNESRLFNGHVYAFSPILKIGKSLGILDTMIDTYMNSREKYNGELTAGLAGLSSKLVSEKMTKQISGKIFHDVLLDAIYDMAQNHEELFMSHAITESEKKEHLSFRTQYERESAQRLNEKKIKENIISNEENKNQEFIGSIRYKSAVRQFSSRNTRYYQCNENSVVRLENVISDLYTQFCGDDLFFWLGKAIKRGQTGFRILSVSNDQLIFDLQDFSKDFDHVISENFNINSIRPMVIRLKSGGHAGYMGSLWLEDLFDRLMLEPGDFLTGTYQSHNFFTRFISLLKVILSSTF